MRIKDSDWDNVGCGGSPSWRHMEVKVEHEAATRT